MNVPFANLNDILHYTTVSGNIDDNKIDPHIYNAQILYIQPILGSDLYDKLEAIIDDGSISGATYENYYTLWIKYITPSLVMHTMELYIPLNAFKIADGGVSQHQSTNAQTTVLDDIDKISNKYRIIGAKYDDLLSKYLNKNKNLFPEFENNDGLVKKTEVTQRNGIYLGLNHTHSKIRI